MKHYAKEKLESLTYILQGLAQTGKTRELDREVVAMFLTYITETGLEVPGAKMSHRARWRAVVTGILAMRWMVCNFWTKKFTHLERPIVAVAAIVDAVDHGMPGDDLRAVIRPIVKGMRVR